MPTPAPPRSRSPRPARVLKETPLALGYTFPAEWEKHEGTWFSWPRPEGISFPGRYHTIPAAYAAIIRHIEPRERVHINVPNENYEYLVREQLTMHGCECTNIRFHHIKTNESWCRDHGPAFVVKPATRKGAKKQMAIVDWGFNAWGGKYPPYDDDDRVPTMIAQELGLPVFNPGIVMEGGAIDVSGEGTLLTTESCLLNKNRNPGLSKKKIEWYLKEYYGQANIQWLGDGIEGDDTDGHVDDLARFISPRIIVTAVEDDPRDANYKLLKENLRRCQLLRDAQGRPFEVVTVPMPGVVEHDGQRLPATYLNFAFVNGAILVPIFRHARHDHAALTILADLLPKRQVIGIDCVDLIWGLGAIHCMSQQQPA